MKNLATLFSNLKIGPSTIKPLIVFMLPKNDAFFCKKRKKKIPEKFGMGGRIFFSP
jgi:hypothetical protein